MDLARLVSTDPGGRLATAQLVIRVAAGFVLAPHGWFKLLDGAQGLAGGLAQKGLPLPSVLAWCATLSELVGGIFLMLGLLTRPTAAVVSFTMVFAWVSAHLGDLPKIGAKGGAAFEYPFLLSMVALGIALVGPGKISLDALIERRVRA